MADALPGVPGRPTVVPTAHLGQNQLWVMSRIRSGSIVQAIASRVPEVENHVDLESIAEGLLRPSKSSENLAKGNEFFSPPLSENERTKLWSKYLKTFEYDLLVDASSENTLFNSKVAKYLDIQNDVILKYNKNRQLLEKINLLFGKVEGLTGKYTTIVSDTHEFQQESNGLITEYAELELLHSKLLSDLSHFDHLNEINGFLNKPGLSKIIRSPKFLKILTKLDSSLKFINLNPDLKDIDSYNVVIQSSMTKSLTLVKNYVINAFNSSYNTILPQLNHSSITSRALLYNKFEVNCLEINRLMVILYQRQSIYGLYEGLITDIYSTYFNLRSRLLQDTINSNIDLDKSLIHILQGNLSFYIDLINDEYELFYKFFNDFRLTSDEEGTSALLDDDYFSDPNFNYVDYLTFGIDEFVQWIQHSILESLYDNLRNKILKEQEIKNLCPLIILLQKYDEEEDKEYYKYQLNFSKFFHPILTDIQSRLIFRVQVYIDEHIIKYKPRHDDFKLVNNGDYYSGWYPTLRESIQLLTQIHQLVNSLIFDDIAHSIVHVCITSLKQGYEYSQKIIGIKDSILFFMKNLLVLKKNIDNFDIEFTNYNDIDFDFSGLKDLFSKFASGTMWQDGLIGIAKESVPKIVNNMYDAKLELQIELRNNVHMFMNLIIKDISEPLKGNTTGASVMKSYRANIELQFSSLKELLLIYIQDTLVINYLIDGIKELIIQNYETYRIQMIKNNDNKDDLNELMEIDSLIDFLNQVTSDLFSEDLDLSDIEAIPEDEYSQMVSLGSD